MRITGFEVFPFANPTPEIGGPVWMFVRLDTDAGISGYGEIFTSSLYSPPLTVARVIADFVEEFAIGEHPGRTERFVHRVYNSHYTRSGDLAKFAIASGVEIAMWDILGKALGCPVHELLGGRMRDAVRMYSYISPPAGHDSDAFWTDDAAIAARCAELVDTGFTALKLDPFPLLTSDDDLAGQVVPVQPTERQLAEAERIVAAVHAGVAGRASVIIGTHGQFTASGAVRVARRLERFDPLWFEEPVPPELPVEMAEVARHTGIPIAAGERLAGKAGFAALARLNAANIFNLDVTQVGGLLESKKIAALAEANGIQVTPHVFGGPLVAAASLQLALTLPNLLVMEGNGVYDGTYADLLVDPIDWRDGSLHPSDRPGMGHDLNEDYAHAHAVADESFQYRRPPRSYR
ncbi:mandelate racemase/muconate lactonizing enzyme family protein [Agromyces intestinalis]|uniref:Mandelate racemase/muconate lactonizing enzyme family protein n=1 Tax=Agromyces intestinalis TaxID=2592652 RepID=A0A5C1YJY3_9MICO|nr:mandelate racemase/muconate lactonizing enzyme family protein [Agromyces intestinalis]QEO15427.1 mandelate racemase/muconate lactonizing enzyme family protein [Agromyces intestinalis]